jgi:hypothetical protein
LYVQTNIPEILKPRSAPFQGKKRDNLGGNSPDLLTAFLAKTADFGQNRGEKFLQKARRNLREPSELTG